MKPPFAYYGGKSRLAPWIAVMLPPHRVYVEPFAGFAAVLFAKSPARHEVLNDMDGHVVCFLRMLRERPDELELACRLTPYARDEFAAADINEPGLDDLERARRWWVRSNQSFAKTGSSATGWSTSILRGSNNATSCWNRIGRFADAARRLAHVTIENRDAVEVLAEYSAADGAVYLDPPYLGDTRTSYRAGRRPNGDYVHEFATAEEHEALAAAAHAYPGTVLLSGYPSGLYEELYADWHRVDRRVVRRTTNGRSGALTHVTESVWSNRPIPNQLRFDESEVAQC